LTGGAVPEAGRKGRRGCGKTGQDMGKRNVQRTKRLTEITVSFCTIPSRNAPHIAMFLEYQRLRTRKMHKRGKGKNADSRKPEYDHAHMPRSAGTTDHTPRERESTTSTTPTQAKGRHALPPRRGFRQIPGSFQEGKTHGPCAHQHQLTGGGEPDLLNAFGSGTAEKECCCAHRRDGTNLPKSSSITKSMRQLSGSPLSTCRK